LRGWNCIDFSEFDREVIAGSQQHPSVLKTFSAISIFFLLLSLAAFFLTPDIRDLQVPQTKNEISNQFNLKHLNRYLKT